VLENVWIEDDARDFVPVGGVGPVGNFDDAVEIDLEKRRNVGEPDIIHLVDNSARVRFDDLSSVFKVDFKPVVVRRVMAGGNDDTSGRAEAAQGETELWCGARSREDEGATAKAGPGGSGEIAEVPGEITHVVGDREARLFEPSLLGEIALGVTEQTDRGADDVEVVEGVAADRRMRRMRPPCAVRAPFRRGADPPDRPSAHSAGSKFERLEEAVAQFIPSFGFDQ